MMTGIIEMLKTILEFSDYIVFGSDNPLENGDNIKKCRVSIN
jgi:predicted TIM-barrel fold metal-dependent hydrolase